jgi:hypothetical protein
VAEAPEGGGVQCSFNVFFGSKGRLTVDAGLLTGLNHRRHPVRLWFTRYVTISKAL